MRFLSNSYYTTTNKSKSLFPTIKFLTSFLKIVYQNGKLAKENKYDDLRWEEGSIKILKYLENVGVEFIIEGLNNLDRTKDPVVIVANHMSVLETVCLPAILLSRKKISFIVKKELSKTPFFKHIIINKNSILLSRNNPRSDYVEAINQAIERIKSGFSVIVFPQKARKKYVDFREFNSLGAKLALKTNAPIVPLALITDAWRIGTIIKDFGKIDPSKKVIFSFGEPIYPTTSQQEIMNKIFEHIKNTFIKFNRQELLV